MFMAIAFPILYTDFLLKNFQLPIYRDIHPQVTILINVKTYVISRS
jgi:hypothetical protein